MPLVDFARADRATLEGIGAEDALCLVPVGATEQHGPHLPPMVDAFLADAVVRAAAERSTARAFVTPAIPFGVSPHHLGLPGTLSLSSDTFRSLVEEVADSLAHAGARTVLFVNGHGGNRPALIDAVQRAGRRAGDTGDPASAPTRILAASYWEVVPDGAAVLRTGPKGSTGHAGAFETSLMLHLAPETVAMDLAVDGTPTSPFPGFASDLFEGATVHGWVDFREASPSGVFGHATRATAEQGRAAFERIADALADLMANIVATQR